MERTNYNDISNLPDGRISSKNMASREGEDENLEHDDMVGLVSMSAPVDKNHTAYWIFYILGVGLLLPWNAFITPYDYFHYLYPHTAIEFIFSLFYQWPTVLMLAAMVKWGHKFSYSVRILCFLALNFISLIIIPFLSLVGTDDTAGAITLPITLFSVLCTGVSTAVLFASIFGFATQFPPSYTQAIMGGNGLAGIVVAVVRIITKLSLPHTTEGLVTSSVIYFALAAIVMIICVIAYLVLIKLPFVKYTLEHCNSEIEGGRLSPVANDGSDNNSASAGEYDGDISNGNGNVKEGPRSGAVLRLIWKQAVNVALVFFVTLSLFPGVVTLIPPTDPATMPPDWFAVILLSLFMVGDWFGRSLPSVKVIFNADNIWIPATLRLVFFPLFLFCVNPLWIRGDFWVYIIMILFSVTNGYISTVVMMVAPNVVTSNKDKETAGPIMTFFLNFGLILGVNFSLFMLYVVTGKFEL